ncbi:hypothetical protein A2774_05830 [Candidatus Roizmanbacteria bacterium RIFCSPHIGHO2_01_FULL_39_12c]|uniref:Regulatory protein RecX n=1 Tax=Candidatus Roizmanbacteria bacterium RIFCSPHIGHO2_01_FULL_39_12c TaxID=1802031 RepID=A0A1F7GAB4_9BACT|nr:MAG: hypothetical protein A2774_05830 [Candidatus Roizmanbacteria bacterium RIFCSPHIGHO2_01_FULL_39_12c]OGK46452.1 MAG: hypothetical protein A2963_01645 [Candidatus Roizmanbacteria bacterium RIFCSPLOWO2_01_FULL_40_13]
MSSNDDLQELFNKAYFYLKFRPRTKKEMQKYLYKKIQKRHFSRIDADKVIADLEEQGLIDDQAFVEWFVEQRARGKPKGGFVLKGELLRLGISKELIDKYLQNNPLDEEKLAFQALKSKWHLFKHLPKKERFEKSAAFLFRRGFSFDTIRSAIRKMEETELDY